MDNYIKKVKLGDSEVIFETGKIARQATGSVLVTKGSTQVLSTVVVGNPPGEHQDFFPLTVNYLEKTYATGKIPGGFFKREGRPTEKETLTSRLIDRPLRPLFNDDFTLSENSPCIDAGTADIDGDGEPDITDYYGEAPDMGAYEYIPSEQEWGDITGDGLINVQDIVLLVNIVLGFSEPIAGSDLNGDGITNVIDVVALVQFVLNN